MNMVNGMPHATLLRLFDLRKRLLALFPQYELPNSSAAIISMNPKMRTSSWSRVLQTVQKSI
jgi:hypothetical protein